MVVMIQSQEFVDCAEFALGKFCRRSIEHDSSLIKNDHSASQIINLVDLLGDVQ